MINKCEKLVDVDEMSGLSQEVIVSPGEGPELVEM